jgi:hypothetical protein
MFKKSSRVAFPALAGKFFQNPQVCKRNSTAGERLAK